MTALMSTSLNVVSMAAVFCASLRRVAMVWRSRVMRTRSSRSASWRATARAAARRLRRASRRRHAIAASMSPFITRPSLPVP
jgi:hypothetical protein